MNTRMCLQTDVMICAVSNCEVVQSSMHWCDAKDFNVVVIDIELQGGTGGGHIDVETCMSCEVGPWVKVCGIEDVGYDYPKRIIVYANCNGGDYEFLRFFRWRVWADGFPEGNYPWGLQFRVDILLRNAEMEMVGLAGV